MVELRASRGIGLDPLRPGDSHWLAYPAEIGPHQLGPLIGRTSCPGPPRVVHVVRLGAAEGIEATQFIQRGDMLRDLGRNAVLRQLLADGAVQAFG